ncbi:MAG TPA: transcription termination/antitermination NusG family protein [Candidatus Dormibacteraeota bacterium]|nr:transcription termination/antitermination NusG family protein [Candidatus Dormibacteraeota bacterium]
MQPVWYVLQTNRNRERVAAAALRQRGIASYLPRIEQWPRPIVGSAVAPLFPGYLFVQMNGDLYAQVSWTPGVKGFVSFGGLAASIDDTAIEFLRSREGSDGIIHCEGGVSGGDQVRIVHGPLRGLTAVVECRLPARERVRVLLQILRSDTPVELPERWVRQA